MGEKSRIRNWFQAVFFAMTNGYITGYTRKKIYTGKLKKLCLPGLNCYSCPGAISSCPIGSLQAVLGSSQFTVSLYVMGFIFLVGTLCGRVVCGWMCPFGLIQDILYKIPVKKKSKNFPIHTYLQQIRIFILAFLVIILPSFAVNATGMGKPWFCEYCCPSGTLFGGIPLVVINESLRTAIGWRFWMKAVILIVTILFSILFYRPFCKYLCPLGLIYGFCNSISFLRLIYDDSKCIKCSACQNACGMNIKVWENPNSADCIRCGDCIKACPEHAISSTWRTKWGKIERICIHMNPMSRKSQPSSIRKITVLLLTTASGVAAYYNISCFTTYLAEIFQMDYYDVVRTVIGWGAVTLSSLTTLVLSLYMILHCDRMEVYLIIKQLIWFIRGLVIIGILLPVTGGDNFLSPMLMLLFDSPMLILLSINKTLFKKSHVSCYRKDSRMTKS